MKRLGLCLAAIIGGATAVSVAVGEPCSGKKISTKNCSEPRACAAIPGGGCITSSVTVYDVQGCVDGVAADNCVVTSQDQACATRYVCTYGVPPGETVAVCYPSAVLGDVTSKKVQNGGSCSVGS